MNTRFAVKVHEIALKRAKVNRALRRNYKEKPCQNEMQKVHKTQTQNKILGLVCHEHFSRVTFFIRAQLNDYRCGTTYNIVAGLTQTFASRSFKNRTLLKSVKSGDLQGFNCPMICLSVA